MREIVEIVQLTAESERRNAEYYRELLEKEKEKKENLEQQLQQARRAQMMSSWEPEPMEIGEMETGAPAETTAEREAKEVKRGEEREEGGNETPPTYNPRITTEEELRQNPWLRPPIKGVITNMEEITQARGKPRIIDNKRVDIRTLKNEKGQKIAAPIRDKLVQSLKAKEEMKTARDKRNKNKGTSKPKNPNWNEMELVSSQSEEETKRIAEAIGYLKKKGIPVLFGGGDRNMPPPPIREGKQAKPPPPPKTGEAPPPGKGKMSEARRRRRYEKRREKRREEARRRILAASAPPPPPPVSRGGRTSGPVTRAMTGAGAPPRAPPSSSPPTQQQGSTQWAQVVGRGKRREGREEAGHSPATQAFIAAGAPKGQAAKAPAGARRGTQGGNQPKAPPKFKKPPRTAAVQITCPEGEKAETMRLARARINLTPWPTDSGRFWPINRASPSRGPKRPRRFESEIWRTRSPRTK